MKRLSIITGHYGSGKTNIAVNLAFKLKETHPNVTLVDLDIVNPYFRTADFSSELEAAGIRLIAPMYANTNLDIPALPAQVNSVFDDESAVVIIDVGGDDAGAIALGRYANQINAIDYDMYYVINERRLLTAEPPDALELLRDIELVSRVKATRLINNTNLGELTTESIVTDSIAFAKQVEKLSSLSVAFTCISTEAVGERLSEETILPVKMFVTSPFTNK